MACYQPHPFWSRKSCVCDLDITESPCNRILFTHCFNYMFRCISIFFKIRKCLFCYDNYTGVVSPEYSVSFRCYDLCPVSVCASIIFHFTCQSKIDYFFALHTFSKTSPPPPHSSIRSLNMSVQNIWASE